ADAPPTHSPAMKLRWTSGMREAPYSKEQVSCEDRVGGARPGPDAAWGHRPGEPAAGGIWVGEPRPGGPRPDLVGVVYPVDERAQLRRRNRDDVTDRMREALSRREPVFRRCEHRAQKQDEPVRILMVGTDGVGDEIDRIAADHSHRARAFERESLEPVHEDRKLAAAHVVDAEALVEQANEGTDGAGRVVVLGLAEQ